MRNKELGMRNYGRAVSIVTNSERETAAFAKKIAAGLRGGETLALIGDLGAGKTTFVQALAKSLGVRSKVRSPSFVLMVPYRCEVKRKTKEQRNRGTVERKKKKTEEQKNIRWLVHVDAYRLKNARQLQNIGLEEYLGRPDTITVIEWADRVRQLLPRNAKRIIFRYGKTETERRISYTFAEAHRTRTSRAVLYRELQRIVYSKYANG